MIKRVRVRKIPRRKRAGKATGSIYFQKHLFAGQSVIVMDLRHYRWIRRQVIVAQRKLIKIKKISGIIKGV